MTDKAWDKLAGFDAAKAKLQYLEFCSKWDLYGSSFFVVDPVRQHQQCGGCGGGGCMPYVAAAMRGTSLYCFLV